MEGFDQKTAQQMLDAMKEDGLSVNMKVMKSIVAGALEAELEYLRKVGILTAKGEFKDGEYDDDDAFDFITEELCKKLPDCDAYVITDYLEYYFDYHDQVLTENGILEWL
ncbi:MAG: hypothetical protein IKK58_04420 [Clostridia bacterium]|nr:hypothetical protein [Clostridia bacterium]